MEMIATMDEDRRPFRGNEIFSLTGKRVWVAGHRGMVGSALVRRLRREACELLTVTREELDLRRQAEVEGWMRASRPDVVLIAAATVGGIQANRSRPAEFIYDNLAITLNIVHTAYEIGVEKLLFLGSSCIYPKYCAQPMTEDQLLSGPLEPTNQWYAIAKLAGLMMAQAFRAQHGMDCIIALPTNLYGPDDNFDLQQGHVVAALLRKLHEAKLNGDRAVEIWGTGRPKREFLHVDDLADALIHLVTHYSNDEPVNIGTGQEVSIAELADLAARVVGYPGQLAYNTSMPDGAPRKLLDVTRMTELGWRSQTPLFEGLQDAYACYLKRLPSIAEADIAV
jgi:GDP-L-fucose synthase